MDKLKIGQILYDLSVGNSARYYGGKLTPVVIKKIGRKYFTAGEKDKNNTDTIYYIETWKEKTDYCVNSVLYKSKKEYEDKKESEEICEKINYVFQYGHNSLDLSIEKLRQIKIILNQGK